MATTYDLTTQSVPIIATGDIINCPFSGKKKAIKLPAGTYKLECWGAQGGSYNTNYGGAGGYSVGTLKLTAETTVYLYAGGQPKVSDATTAIASGGFNGGGAARYHSYSGTTSPCQAGGGGSDIRIGSDSLYARVIVAGGGGGAAAADKSDLATKYGGGESGGSAQSGYGATQTAAGTNGKFGVGADGYISSSNYKYASGGGGGGWYGGGASNQHSDSTDYTSYNGGGSGYVYTRSSASAYPSGCLLSTSHQLTSASTSAGNVSFKAPSGSSETGHMGDGHVRITASSVSTSGGGTTLQSFDLTTASVPSKLAEGDVLNCPYSGEMKSVTLPKGKYVIECWGAQGGYRSSTSYGGRGGYSVGTLTLSKKSTLYLYAGGAGNSMSRVNQNSTILIGGFNGGGYRNTYTGGGGASDVRIGTDSLYARVIVAGGGGSDGATAKTGMYGGGETGGSSTQSYSSVSSYGGKGGTQTYSGYSAAYTITEQFTDASGLNSNTTANYCGGFGFGGGGVALSNGYGGAGGGGWYGGSGNVPDGSGDDDRGGGGGSGYIYTSTTATNYPSGCLLDSSHYLESALTRAGNLAFLSPTNVSETGHAGDGYVRITVLEVENAGPRVKVNGAWKESSGTYVKVNGVWKEVSDIYVKVNGVWKKQ